MIFLVCHCCKLSQITGFPKGQIKNNTIPTTIEQEQPVKNEQIGSDRQKWECCLCREQTTRSEWEERKWSIRSGNNVANTKSRGHSGFKLWPQILGYSSLCSCPLRLAGLWLLQPVEYGRRHAVWLLRLDHNGHVHTFVPGVLSCYVGWASCWFSRWQWADSSLPAISAQVADMWVKKFPNRFNIQSFKSPQTPIPSWGPRHHGAEKNPAGYILSKFLTNKIQ